MPDAGLGAEPVGAGLRENASIQSMSAWPSDALRESSNGGARPDVAWRLTGRDHPILGRGHLGCAGLGQGQIAVGPVAATTVVFAYPDRPSEVPLVVRDSATVVVRPVTVVQRHVLLGPAGPGF